MTESKRENVLVPEVLDDDAPMPEVLTAEDIEYLEEPFECPEELDIYERLPRPSSPIESSDADVAFEAALNKKNTEPAIEALREALRIRTDRERNHDRADFNDFAGYLNSIKKEIGFRVLASKHQVFEIGKLIYEAKVFVSEWCRGKSENTRMLGRGYFSSWLEDNFPLSRSSIMNFVRVYKACLGFEESVKYFPASTLYLMSEPRFPKDVREYLLQNAKKRFKGKRAEIMELAARVQSGEIAYDGKEIRRILGNSVEHTVATNIVRELAGIEKSLASHKKAIEERQNRSVAEPLVSVEESGKGHPLYLKAIELIEKVLKDVQDHRKVLQEAGGLPD
ncbi:MAG: hypothetical protein ACLP29_08100 [Dissulfurispiraceae bacterium]